MVQNNRNDLLTVGIADMIISDNPSDILVTYSLGSCVGLTLYDPEVKIGGMVHTMLPLSKQDPEKAMNNPFMYTDTGIQSLIQALFDMGASRRRLIAKVAGGAKLMDEKSLFRIGERNYTVLRKVLWKNDILISAEDVGETKSRTLFLYMDTGKTVIRSSGKEVDL